MFIRQLKKKYQNVCNYIQFFERELKYHFDFSKLEKTSNEELGKIWETRSPFEEMIYHNIKDVNSQKKKKASTCALKISIVSTSAKNSYTRDESPNMTVNSKQRKIRDLAFEDLSASVPINVKYFYWIKSQNRQIHF